MDPFVAFTAEQCLFARLNKQGLPAACAELAYEALGTAGPGKRGVREQVVIGALSLPSMPWFIQEAWLAGCFANEINGVCCLP